MGDMDISVKDAALSHHGVKGMKWGVRRQNVGGPNEVVVSTDPSKKAKKIKTSGGENHPAHPDAITAAVANRKLKKSGVAALSNEELSTLSTRMNLEQNVVRLNSNQPTHPGKKFIKQLLLSVGKQQVTRVANDQATKQVDKMMSSKAKK